MPSLQACHVARQALRLQCYCIFGDSGTVQHDGALRSDVESNVVIRIAVSTSSGALRRLVVAVVATDEVTRGHVKLDICGSENKQTPADCTSDRCASPAQPHLAGLNRHADCGIIAYARLDHL